MSHGTSEGSPSVIATQETIYVAISPPPPGLDALLTLEPLSLTLPAAWVDELLDHARRSGTTAAHHLRVWLAYQAPLDWEARGLPQGTFRSSAYRAADAMGWSLDKATRELNRLVWANQLVVDGPVGPAPSRYELAGELWLARFGTYRPGEAPGSGGVVPEPTWTTPKGGGLPLRLRDPEDYAELLEDLPERERAVLGPALRRTPLTEEAEEAFFYVWSAWPKVRVVRRGRGWAAVDARGSRTAAEERFQRILSLGVFTRMQLVEAAMAYLEARQEYLAEGNVMEIHRFYGRNGGWLEFLPRGLDIRTRWPKMGSGGSNGAPDRPPVPEARGPVGRDDLPRIHARKHRQAPPPRGR